MACHKRRVSGQLLGFWIYITRSGWSSNSSVCPVHENIFKQYYETCSAKTTPSKCSSKYKQKPILFLVKTGQSEKTKADRIGMFWQTNNAAVHTSFAIALHVAKAKKAHTIGETLLKPCILESVKLMLVEKASQTMKRISLSNDTIKSRIHEIFENIKSKLISKINSLLFLLFSWMKLPMFPISHSYLCISDMLQMKRLMKNFSSANLWKQNQRQPMFFKC